MPTIDATTSQGGYLKNTKAEALTTWEETCYAFGTATTIDSNGQLIYTQASYAGGRSATWSCSRGYLVFDTSVITGTLTAISLNIFCTGIFDLVYTPNAVVYLGGVTPTLSTALATTDYGFWGAQASDPFTSVGSTWENIGLNATALSVAETENEMALVLRDSYYDAELYTNLTDPPGNGYMEFYNNEAGFVPYLDYTMVTGYGQTVNGIIAASYQSVDAIAKINISKVLGV